MILHKRLHPVFTWFLASLLLALPWYAQAQSTTANIQGTIVDETGPLPGATIVAKDTQSGYLFEAVAGPDGAFTLSGLRPGTYEISVAMNQYKPQSRTVQVQVGQSVTVNFKVTPDVLYTEQVQVTADSRLIETRTSEITTTVTTEQVRYLPQNQRNFLNFAALAPGARVSDNETRKQVTGGGLDATQINVFIDGVSYKNDVLDGGVVGQDSSRGSPFPQTAVQEFQVLTQNYKAEHEKASSLVISAVTKSGGNRWSGEGFLFYQNKDLVDNEYFAEQRGDPKPTYKRFQPGVAIGGPIVRDKIQVFGSYEENRQDRANRVFVGSTPFPPSLDFLRSYEGTFVSPFREKLFFAKLTAQPRSGQAAEVSYSLRHETDIRSFGQQTSFDSAENVRNRVDSASGRWTMSGARALNEATLTYQRSNWNPEPENITDVGLNYIDVMRIGGRDTTQDFIQTRVSLRDDYTRFIQWNGGHTLKAGAVLSFLKYEVAKLFNGNPVFEFRRDEQWAFPFQARYGVGNPDLSTDNRQLGFFVQDDWAVGPRTTINAGIRWDYESDMLNNDYVTPEFVRTATAPFVDGSRYFTNGDDRPPFYGAWQPRVGFSYDLTGGGRHILFGGYGRYYDRVIYNAGLDERFRLQYAVRTFQFSLDGAPRNGQPTIIWNPSYQSKAGLDGLIAAGIAPTPEVFLIDNDTKPPVTDQFNAGLRTSVRGILFSANYAGIRGRNSLTFIFGNRRPDGTCCQTIPGVFTNILISSAAKKSWFDALYVTAERPFDRKWGFRVNYTLGQAEAIGGDLFSLDYRRVEDYPRHPSSTDERHRLVITGIFGLPADFIVSTFTTLASGLGYTIVDNSLGSGIDQRRVLLFAGRPPEVFNYKSVDLRVEKIFALPNQQHASIAFEGFNIFDATNFSGYNGTIPVLPATNPNFGLPTTTVETSSRRLQFGVRYSF
jgi:Carboxypeptidase regulatory-like domain/TonB dependent receptor-like, beta-barrel